MKISQGQNLVVGLRDKDEFGPSPGETGRTHWQFSNVPGPKCLFVFVPNGLERILTVGVAGRRVPQLRGPGQLSTDRRTWIMRLGSSRRDRGC